MKVSSGGKKGKDRRLSPVQEQRSRAPCNLLWCVSSVESVYYSKRNQTIWWNKLINFLNTAPTNQKQEDNKRPLYTFRLFLRLPNALLFHVIRLQVRLHLTPRFAPGVSGFSIVKWFPCSLSSIIRLIWIDMWFHLIFGFCDSVELLICEKVKCIKTITKPISSTFDYSIAFWIRTLSLQFHWWKITSLCLALILI